MSVRLCYCVDILALTWPRADYSCLRLQAVDGRGVQERGGARQTGRQWEPPRPGGDLVCSQNTRLPDDLHSSQGLAACGTGDVKQGDSL